MFDVRIVGPECLGLPLALSKGKRGLKEKRYVINEEIIHAANNKIIPFREKGFGDLFRDVDIEITIDKSRICYVWHIIITVGTLF